jgi:hypothetical protein
VSTWRTTTSCCLTCSLGMSLDTRPNLPAAAETKRPRRLMGCSAISTLRSPVDQDDEVGNLIRVSFVENAQGVPGDMEEPLRTRLRGFPHLAEALSHYD